jgi:hypothetical protein
MNTILFDSREENKETITNDQEIKVEEWSYKHVRITRATYNMDMDSKRIVVHASHHHHQQLLVESSLYRLHRESGILTLLCSAIYTQLYGTTFKHKAHVDYMFSLSPLMRALYRFFSTLPRFGKERPFLQLLLLDHHPTTVPDGLFWNWDFHFPIGGYRLKVC